MSGLDAITNACVLADDLGTSGQPTADQFAAIRAAGYEAVINLALPTSEHAIADEGTRVTELGMIYVHIPVDFADPTEADYAAFRGILTGLAGRRVWVHCVVNARVSAFCYRWLREERGLDEAAATSPVLAAWRPRMDAVWSDFLARTTV